MQLHCDSESSPPAAAAQAHIRGCRSPSRAQHEAATCCICATIMSDALVRMPVAPLRHAYTLCMRQQVQSCWQREDFDVETRRSGPVPLFHRGFLFVCTQLQAVHLRPSFAVSDSQGSITLGAQPRGYRDCSLCRFTVLRTNRSGSRLRRCVPLASNRLGLVACCCLFALLIVGVDCLQHLSA